MVGAWSTKRWSSYSMGGIVANTKEAMMELQSWQRLPGRECENLLQREKQFQGVEPEDVEMCGHLPPALPECEMEEMIKEVSGNVNV